MSPYPPGMGRRDKIRAGIIEPHAHEHEFPPSDEVVYESEMPFIEDGKAHFKVECGFVEILGSTHSEKHDETFYEEGRSCDETREWSMDQVSLTRLKEDSPNVTYLTDELDHFTDLASIEWGLIRTEQNGELVECNPDPDFGRVVIETDNWRAVYEA